MNYIAPIKFYFAIVNRCKVQQKSFFAKNDQTGKGTSFPVAYTLTVGLASFPVHIFRLIFGQRCHKICVQSVEPIHPGKPSFSYTSFTLSSSSPKGIYTYLLYK